MFCVGQILLNFDSSLDVKLPTFVMEVTDFSVVTYCLIIFVQIHPDLNPGDPNSHAKFVRLNEAYSILSDVNLRQKYDLRFVHCTGACHSSQSYDSSFHRHSASYSYYRWKSI